MKIKGNTICFKSDRVYYDKEESGLKPNTIRIIAYSDTQQGHKGTIYKAANWKHTKKVKPAPWSNRKNRRGIIGGEKLKFERHLYPNNHQ